MTTRNDATRLRIPVKDPRHLRAVVTRQGLALLDTDLDQQSRHQLDRIETETADSLGSPGKLLVPAGNTGFQISLDPNLKPFKIGAGHGYLDGWLLENASDCQLDTQPHPWNEKLDAADLIAIKALVRFVDPVEDPALADVALRDAQASGRSIVDWQVFPFPVGGGNAITCQSGTADAAWQALIAPSTGTLTVIEQAPPAANDPCTLTPAGGFNRKENLNYRFEVHGGDTDGSIQKPCAPRLKLDNLQIKFSRRNASVMARVTDVAGTQITVAAPPLDPRNWFAPGQFAEVVSIHDDVDPRAAMKPGVVRMYRVALAVDDKVVLEEANAGDINKTGIGNDGTWFLRLWDAFPDGKGLATVVVQGNGIESQEIDTGDGFVVKVGLGTFHHADYWTCAARADGTLAWLKAGNVPQPMKPHGPEVRYASLASMNGAPNAIALEDCRVPFATLSDRLLVYRGGDGQGVFTTQVNGMIALPGKLRVGVMRGENPVGGAAVQWSFVGPVGGSSQINGALCDAANSPQTLADANGLAEVTWSIDAAKPADLHQVQASLVGLQGVVPPPIVFSAAFETAARTAYTPGQCQYLLKVDNVQDAIDTLCSKIGEAKRKVISLRSIVLRNGKVSVDLLQRDILLNGQQVSAQAFANGIFFGFDTKLDIELKGMDYHPIAEIDLDLPYPDTDPDRLYWAQSSMQAARKNQPTRLTEPFGFRRLRLDGAVTQETVESEAGTFPGIAWRPSAQAAYFLASAAQHAFGARVMPDYAARLKELQWNLDWRPQRILCRIRLRSAHIWAGKENDRIYLNAEHLGTSRKTRVELLAGEVDPQRAADLDMFIYLQEKFA
jgi:hypothetical protein